MRTEKNMYSHDPLGIMEEQPVIVPTMITLKEAVKRTGLSYSFLRKACSSGEIVSVKCGRKYLVNLEKLVDFLNGKEVVKG